MATIADIMSSGLLTVEPAATLVEAAKAMSSRHVGAALVFDGERLVGILTERDVLNAVAAGSIADACVRDCMTQHPETVDAGDSTGHAAALMIHGGFRHLPVAEGSRIVGIVSIRDLIRVTLDDESPRGV
jgi:CBS domain-containing protein